MCLFVDRCCDSSSLIKLYIGYGGAVLIYHPHVTEHITLAIIVSASQLHVFTAML